MGPARDRYRGFRVWITATRSKRTTNTVEWSPIPYQYPLSNPKDIINLSLETIQRQLLGLGTNISYPNIHEAQIKDAVIPLKNVIAEVLKAKRFYPDNTPDNRPVYQQEHDNNNDVTVQKQITKSLSYQKDMQI
jgi:hypothetical protein